MIRNLMGLSNEEYHAYVDAMSDIWAEDLKLYGPRSHSEDLETNEADH